MKVGTLVKIINHKNKDGKICYRTCTGTIGLIVEVRPYTTKTNVVLDVQTLVNADGESTDYSGKSKEERYLEVTIDDVAPVKAEGELIKIVKGDAVKLVNNKSIFIVLDVKESVVEVLDYVTGVKRNISIYCVDKKVGVPQLSSDWLIRPSKTKTDKLICSNKKYPKLSRKYIDKDNFVAHHHELISWFKTAKAKHIQEGTKPGMFVKATQNKTYKYGKYVQSKVMTNVHDKAGWFSELLATKYVDTIMSKYSSKFEPESKTDNYIGCEVECFTKLTHEKLAIFLAKKGMMKFVRLTGDASIRADSGMHAVEIRFLTKESEYRQNISKLFDILNEPEVGVKTNNSCGLHVHFDMRNRKVDKVYENLMCMMRLVRAAIPEHRRSNTYCRTPASPFYSEQVKNAQHYDAISLTAYNKQKTLEIRMLEGTTDKNVLLGWVKMWTDLIAIPEIDRNYASVDKFQKDFPDFDTEWLKARIEKCK